MGGPQWRKSTDVYKIIIVKVSLQSNVKRKEKKKFVCLFALRYIYVEYVQNLCKGGERYKVCRWTFTFVCIELLGGWLDIHFPSRFYFPKIKGYMTLIFGHSPFIFIYNHLLCESYVFISYVLQCKQTKTLIPKTMINQLNGYDSFLGGIFCTKAH